MLPKEILHNELDALPEDFTKEIFYFLRSLKTKRLNERMETASISESALGKDWLLPEEDAAWQNL